MHFAWFVFSDLLVCYPPLHPPDTGPAAPPFAVEPAKRLMSASLPVPKSFGLTYDPPSITVVYALDEKLRECKPHSPCLPCPAPRHARYRPCSLCAGKRTMPVRDLHAGADPDELARGITAAHPALLGPQAVSHQQARRPAIGGPSNLARCDPAVALPWNATARLLGCRLPPHARTLRAAAPHHRCCG